MYLARTFRLLALSATMTLGLISCGQDEKNDVQTGLTEQSDKKQMQITLDIEVNEPQIEIATPEITKAINVAMTTKNNKKRALLALKDQDQIPLGIVLYSKADNQITGRASATGIYDATTKKIIIKGDYTFEGTGLTNTNSDFLVRVFTGSTIATRQYSYGSSTMSASFASTSGTYAVGNLNDSSPIALDVPFYSDWITPTKTKVFAHTNLYVEHHGMTLKPLGTLVSYTFTNNMDQEVSFDSFKVETNALVSDVAVDFSPNGYPELTATPDANHFSSFDKTALPRWEPTDSKEKTAMRTYTYALGETITLASKGKSDKVLVAWYMPTGINTHKAYSETVYARTHVYASPKAADGQLITKPNYDIVPIMGTDIALENKKSYLVEAEFYEQPKLQLGYISQYAVNYDGKSFYKQHPTTAENIPLLRRPQTETFYNWTTNDDHGVEIEGKTYYMPMTSHLIVSGYSMDIAFGGKSGLWGTRRERPKQASLLGTDDPTELGLINTKFGARGLVSNVEKDVSYFLSYRSENISTVGKPVRNRHQALNRVVATRSSDNTVHYTTVTSVYLGKYFVGDITDNSFNDHTWWDQADHLTNRVQRRFYLPGIINPPATFQNIPASAEGVTTDSKAGTTYRNNVGNYTIFWAVGGEGTLRQTDQYTYWLVNAGLRGLGTIGADEEEAIKSNVAGSAGNWKITTPWFYGKDSSYYFTVGPFTVNNPYLFFFRVLYPYSKTYVGDDIQ